MPLNESHIENLTLRWLEDVGWQVAYGPDGKTPERDCYSEVFLKRRLKSAIHRLNPDISEESCQGVIRKLTQTHYSSILEENQRLHHYLTNGVEIEVQTPEGPKGKLIHLIDFETPNHNDLLAVQQFTVIEGHKNKRPDVVLFINGLPVVVMELKNPTKEMATIESAWQQVETYKREIPKLFRTNAFLILSDGLYSRFGSVSSDFQRFMRWVPEDVQHSQEASLKSLINSLLKPATLLEFIQHFIVFQKKDDGRKIVAAHHQFCAVRQAVMCTREAIQGNHKQGNHKIGVVWHTQGSGKSLLMVFYAAYVIKDPFMKNPTVVVVTDRNDLDNQLFDTFSSCSDFLRQPPKQAEDRKSLRELLNTSSGGVIFTTLQKFTPEGHEKNFPCLTDRSNVVVLVDEAHRSQYGFEAKLTKKGVSYGFAKHLRDALPHASFIAFTGTPIEQDQIKSTTAVFGNYIHKYTMKDAEADKVVVPIHYQGCLPRLHLKADELDELIEADQAMEELIEEVELRGEKLPVRFAQVLGAKNRLQEIANHLVNHFDKQQEVLNGKAMVVCSTREICVNLYNEIIRLRPDWHSDDDTRGAVKIVMTGSNQDPWEWSKHTGNKVRRDLMAKRARDTNDPLKLVIVRDMWLTGFDIPCLHTLYVDKYMKGHGLMQAIARVNRIFPGKENGLVVDYIGIGGKLKNALATYYDSTGSEANVCMDEAKLVDRMMRCYEDVLYMLRGFTFQKTLHEGTSEERLHLLAKGVDFVLALQKNEADKKYKLEEKKKSRLRFPKAVDDLWSAYASVVSCSDAQKISLEVAFFKAIQVALLKNIWEEGTRTASQIRKEVQEFINKVVGSTEISDILEAAGLRKDIPIFSEQFFRDLKNSEYKNLALEGLKISICNEIQSSCSANVVLSKQFSERLKAIIDRYHNSATTAHEAFQEMEDLAKNLAYEATRSEMLNLTEEEMAYYSILERGTDHSSDDERLRQMTHALVVCINKNAGLDWVTMPGSRAKLKLAIKNFLEKYNYFADEVLDDVMAQAEAFSES